jgi:cellulose synthase/poly-beta-1,6-N-acetylglucosamine synthase-like glycosyltransferase
LSLSGVLIVLSAAWIVFAYAGYPLLLWLLRRLSPRPVRAGDVFPPISVIITVHNGAAKLRQKLEGTLALDYPGEREVIVTSDGSTDATPGIAREFEGRGVRLVDGPERRGKEAAQAAAIAVARGEILVFTDVGSQLEPDALRNIVRPFADPSVGCVSSEDVVDSEGGEGAYVRYEMAIRRLESEATSLIGLSGSCFAARREICDHWPTDLTSDFRTALEAARHGLRAVCEPSARARFGATGDVRAEWQRKVRTVRRGLAVLIAYRGLLRPRFGRAALSLWGHKVARFTAPLACLVLLCASLAAAATSPVALALALAQGVFYAAGLLSLCTRAAAAHKLARIAGFFILVNASILVAWAHALRGERVVTWEPTRR